MPSPSVTSPQVAVNDIGSSEDFLAAIDKTIKYFKHTNYEISVSCFSDVICCSGYESKTRRPYYM